MNQDLEKFQKTMKQYSEDVKEMVSLIDAAVSMTEAEMALGALAKTMNNRMKVIESMAKLERMMFSMGELSPFTKVTETHMQRGIGDLIQRGIKMVLSSTEKEEGDTVSEDDILNMFKKLDDDG